MLAHFTVRRTYHRARITLCVSVEDEGADLMCLYDGRIHRMGEVPFREVRTPDAAEAFLSRQSGQHASLIERMEWEARHGI